MNFTIYYDDENGHAKYMFNIFKSKMNWAWSRSDMKTSDPDDMAELLREANNSGMSIHIAIAGD